MVLRWSLLVLAATAVVAASCGRGQGQVVLDGSPRRPDAFGVVRSVTADALVLADGSRWRITADTLVFSSQTMQSVALAGVEGDFVHVGVEGDRVQWISAVAAVLPGDRPSAWYVGTVVEVAEGEVVLEDGTVLPIGRSVQRSALRGFVQLEIDPGTGEVVQALVP